MAATKAKKPSSKIVKAGMQNAEPATIHKVQQAAKMISRGKSRATVIEWLMDTFGLAQVTATAYYENAVRFLLPDDESKFKETLIKANATRLETVYERAMDAGDLKAATEAIAQLNKMLGIGKEGITVGVQNDKENDTQQVIIHFDK